MTIQELQQVVEDMQIQFDFAYDIIWKSKKIEDILAKLSPPYKPAPRGCGIVEERLCESTNK